MDLKDTYTLVFLKAADCEIDDEIIKKIKPLWWFNCRSKNNGGLRLTQTGLDFVNSQAQIKTYNVEIDKSISITPQILIWLDQFIECPYFIDSNSIIVLKERVAFELHLFRGDIKKMGYAKAMNKQLNQKY